MSSFDPRKLSVRYIPPAAIAQPLEGRKYTLTHSDRTAELFLDIGYVWNFEAINPVMRDEVLAEWKMNGQNQFYLMGMAYVDGGEFSKEAADIRFKIFNKEMSTALKGMIYGDRQLYSYYPFLLDAPIYISFDSTYPAYKQIVFYGTPRQYLESIAADQRGTLLSRGYP
ncbi:staygreen family protein [Halobacillus halophilus]|uniref:staygreen family protein n=1 Tax=Halobacillus halophilus TaxID=1570 RepID=UPI001CD7495A|nr:staygreen family protein [Halobacillus halophilus]MCA1011615.1 staygreen family protein [Halobacillus halophilus]